MIHLAYFMKMTEQWFTFEDEAWIFNWTEIKEDRISKEQDTNFGRKGWKGYISSERGNHDRDHPSHNPIVECVLLSVFGTLIGLFVVFQLVLYIRFCITGHHDWKWSLPYILRMRRINCRRPVRRQQDHEGQAQSTENQKVPVESKKASPSKRWSINTKSRPDNRVWAHMYPGGSGRVVPCRPGFFFTTRSLSSYFRAFANSMSPSRASPQASENGDPASEPGNLPVTLFLAGQQGANPPVSTLTPSVHAKSACHTKWRQKNESSLMNRDNPVAKSADLKEPSQPTADVVLFHCENPGYESDASLGLSPTDDEETTDQADASEVSPLPDTPPIPVPRRVVDPTSDRFSDDSLTSISSLSGTSGRISRSHSHGSIRYNSLRFIRDRPGIYIRNRPSSTASEHKSRRLRARASSRCSSDASELRRYAHMKTKNGFLQYLNKNELNKLRTQDLGVKERKCRMRWALELNDELYPLNNTRSALKNADNKVKSEKESSEKEIIEQSPERCDGPDKASSDGNN